MHARKHARTHTHLPEAGWRQLEVLGASDRERWVLSRDLKEDKVWACRTRKGDCSRRGGPMKDKAGCPWNSLRLFAIRNNSAIISRGAESSWWDIQFKRVREVWSSARDHAVADCGNRVFCSAFCWQSVQIHKNMFAPGRLAGKMSSTVHRTLHFVYRFLRNSS